MLTLKYTQTQVSHKILDFNQDDYLKTLLHQAKSQPYSSDIVNYKQYPESAFSFACACMIALV